MCWSTQLITIWNARIRALAIVLLVIVSVTMVTTVFLVSGLLVLDIPTHVLAMGHAKQSINWPTQTTLIFISCGIKT